MCAYPNSSFSVFFSFRVCKCLCLFHIYIVYFYSFFRFSPFIFLGNNALQCAACSEQHKTQRISRDAMRCRYCMHVCMCSCVTVMQLRIVRCADQAREHYESGDVENILSIWILGSFVWAFVVVVRIARLCCWFFFSFASYVSSFLFFFISV